MDKYQTKNRALRSAYRRGYAAAIAGRSRTPPYSDARTVLGSVTWSRAFIRSWLQGYDAAMRRKSSLTP